MMLNKRQICAAYEELLKSNPLSRNSSKKCVSHESGGVCN